MDSVKTDDELTSTVGNVLSTSKEEKNDSSDATPTSSTDANTKPKASQTVSDDPISSTSSDTFDQSKTTDMKSVDEPDRAQTEDHVGDLLEMQVSNEKITEDVEDLVHDLESLLGEPQEAFNLPSKKDANCKGDASANVKTDEKNDVKEDKVEKIENSIDDTTTGTASNLADDTKDINIKENSESNLKPALILPSVEENLSTNKDNQDISESTGESSNADADKDATSKSAEETISCTPVDQIACEQTSQINPNDSAIAVSTQKIETTNLPVDDDSDSIGSWELVNAEALSPIPGPSGEPIQAPIDTNTAEDITSSEDKASSAEINKENEENREADSVQAEQKDDSEEPDVEDQSEQLVSEQTPDKNGDEIREAEPSESNELTKEAEVAASQTEEESEAESETNRNANASQNVESPVEISSSEVGSKPETEIQETTVEENLEATPMIEPSEPKVESQPSVSSEIDETKATEADMVDQKDMPIENVEECPKDAETEETDIAECSDSLIGVDLVKTVPKSEEQDENTTNEPLASTKTDVADEPIEKQADVTEENATQVEEDVKSDGTEAKSLQVEEHVKPIKELEYVTEENTTRVEKDVNSDGTEAKSLQVKEHAMPIEEQEDVTEENATQVEGDVKSDGIEATSLQVEEHVMPIEEQEDITEENTTQDEKDVKSDGIEAKSLQIEEHVMLIEEQGDVTEENATRVEEDVKSDGIEVKLLQKKILIEEQGDVTEENATRVEEDVKSDGIETTSLQVEEHVMSIKEQEDITEENTTQVEKQVKSDGIEAKSLQIEEHVMLTEEHVMLTEEQGDVTKENATLVEEDIQSDSIEAKSLQVEEHVMAIEEHVMPIEENVMPIEEQEDATEENITEVEKEVKSDGVEANLLQVEEDSKSDVTEEKSKQVEEQGAKTADIEKNLMQLEEVAETDSTEEITPEVKAEDSASPKSEQCKPSSEVKGSESTEPQKESSVITYIEETSEVDISKPIENEGCSEESSNLTENQEIEAESDLKQGDEVGVQSVKSKNEEFVDALEKVESEAVELQKESATEDLNNEQLVKASDDVVVEEKHIKKLVENEDDCDDINESPEETTDDAKDVSGNIVAGKKFKKLEGNQKLKEESTVPATEPENSMINKETEMVSEKVNPKPILERKQSHLADLEFAPLQLSEDDSDDSEPVPRLALEPDDSNSPAVAEVNELPAEDTAETQPVEEIEDKLVYIPPVVQPVTVMRHVVQPVVPLTRNISGNQLVVSMAGCLQKMDGLKHTEPERIVSEKERKEMEALALAIQSITDNSNSYMDEYMEPIVEENLQYETNLQEVIQEEGVIEPLVSQEAVAIEAPIEQEDIVIEPSVCQEDAAIEASVCQEEAAIAASVCQEDSTIEASVRQEQSAIEASVCQEEAAIEASVCQEEAAIEASVCQKEVAIEPPVSKELESVMESQNIEPDSSENESNQEAVSDQSSLEVTSTQEIESVISTEIQESQVQEEPKVDSEAASLKSTETDQDEPAEVKNENKIEEGVRERDQKANEAVEEKATVEEDKEVAEKKYKDIVEVEDKGAVAKEVKEAIVEVAKEPIESTKEVEVESVNKVTEAAVNETIQDKVSDVDVVSKENASQSSENSQDSINSTNEVPIKEGKRTRSNEKSKKHKKGDKYEELTINVDVPDKEITYSPKITIKPIKMHDDEVSTTTSSECEVFKGSLKMTITKQSDKMHSILKISDQDNSEAGSEQDEPIPKLIIKPKIQQVESQHSPKMSTRSSKVSPTVSNQRSGSPRILIKPLAKPDKQEPVSPLKIKINTKANSKTISKEDETSRKVSIKPMKIVDESEQVQSPRITIKPIPKPDSEKEVANPRLTIKPIRKPEEDVENEDKERSSPKIIIKPVIKPQESDTHTEEEDGVKERIVLKINKGNLPSPVKESKKREHPPDDDKSEKLAKITVKFSKGGGHPHIVHQQGEDTSKRSHEDNPSNTEKNKKQKIDSDVVVLTRSSARHKDQVEANDKSSPTSEAKTKHKDHHAQESPIETKRPRKDNLNDKSKLLKDDMSEELLSIDTKVDSPIVISEDSRSQDSSSVILLDESKDDSVSSDTIRTPDSTKSIQKAVALNTGSATPSPVLKRGRGRPRKVPLSVREQPNPSIKESPKLKEHPQSKESDASPAPQQSVQVRESGRPKRSCRGQSVCDTLGIKPRKPRGGGRGRGSKRGMGSRLVVERDPSAENASEEEVKLEIKVEVKVEESDKPSEIIDKKGPNTSKIEVVVIEDEPNPKNTKKPNIKRKSIEKKVETDIPVIEIDSGDSQLSEKEPETNKNVSKKSDDNIEPMDVDDNDKEVEIITKNPKIEGSLAIPSTSSDQEATTLDDKRAILKDIGILEEKPIDIEDKEVEQKKTLIEDDTAIPFQSLAPPSTPKDFSELDSQIIESSSPCKPSKQDIPSVSSTTVSSEIMIVDEETRMSAETNSRAQTPAKQVITSSDIVEESQSSVHSTTTTESGKTPSRPSKAPRLEVQEPESQIITADLLSEYYWNGNGPFMLQEQVAQFLGIKSFKRKYPGIMRRMLDMQERDFIREKSLASEHMCDLGLTAVNSADILDIMYSDFQEKYEEYCKHQRDRQAKELINKQKALSLATSQEKSKADITEQAVHSAAQWNARFNKERKEQRKACMDLQNFTVHYPKGKKSSPVTNPHPGNYPVALVPGQFAEYYKEFTPTELNNLPINTMGYEEVHFIPREVSDESGSESDSDSSSSSGSSSCSSSDSDSSSGIDDCKLCKHSPKKPSTAVAPMSPPPAVAPPLATAK